ncbi:MAG: SUMF1/EgtB/PvdO family nonheme iron enzyme [Planctomycetales bacterium]
MPRSLLITFVLLLAGTTFLLSSDPLRGRSSSFVGTKAGDRRELVPGFPFRWCPAGTFIMGSPPTEWVYDYERPDNEDQVTVTLTQGYWLGETEVTQGQWGSVMGSVPPRARTSSRTTTFPSSGSTLRTPLHSVKH